MKFIWFGPSSQRAPLWVKDGVHSQAFFWQMLAEDPKIFTVAYGGVVHYWKMPLLYAAPICKEHLSQLSPPVFASSVVNRKPTYDLELLDIYASFLETLDAQVYLQKCLQLFECVELLGELYPSNEIAKRLSEVVYEQVAVSF